MDKKSIIGYVLIGIVLIGYFSLNQPSPEDLAAQKHRQDSIEMMERIMELEQEKAEEKKLAEIERQKNDSTDLFFNVLNGKEENVILSNDKVNVNISSLGSRVTQVSLKDYKDQKGNDIVLFSGSDRLNGSDNVPGDNVMNFTFESKQGYKNINSESLYSTPIEQTDSSVTMRLAFGNDRHIDFKYLLRHDSYMFDLLIETHNMDEILSSKKDIEIDWQQLIRQQEPGYDFEQRYTSLTYKPVDDGSDYLNEMKDDSEKLKEPISWLAYKNQFFSCIMIAGEQFNNVSLDSKVIEKGQGILKECSATMTVPFDPTGKKATALQFYFGPNKFSTLRESSEMALNQGEDLELEELIYFGWPIVRWINRYFIMYLFDGLSSLGLNMGIVLILLTLIVKAIVYPFTKKSYVSSAKMRALKPYVDEINKKYPKQEDALKKQQETMTLYNKYGASPMGGCLPMLIQMPVFIALFNFVPNAIELRQQSFLWAHDLSAYDAIISWEKPIWLLGDHISLFCLLFCVTQILNTYYTSKMQPSMGGSPEMEQQQKIMRWMMYLMPVMFFFIFNDYSAGLNFYYFVSTLMSVGIFVYLRKAIKDEELLKKMEAYAESNKNNPKKQSSMMERLEALQEQQRKLLEEQERIKKGRNAKKNK
ncbi:MAG: membrane protein insertase YidC [Bacteroidaceae bacterium]|nr:membrane protein insertase YidC [Bacteroidaceae bacterium]